jgi:hypothetical protein
MCWWTIFIENQQWNSYKTDLLRVHTVNWNNQDKEGWKHWKREKICDRMLKVALLIFRDWEEYRHKRVENEALFGSITETKMNPNWIITNDTSLSESEGD